MNVIVLSKRSNCVDKLHDNPECFRQFTCYTPGRTSGVELTETEALIQQAIGENVAQTSNYL